MHRKDRASKKPVGVYLSISSFKFWQSGWSYGTGAPPGAERLHSCCPKWVILQTTVSTSKARATEPEAACRRHPEQTASLDQHPLTYGPLQTRCISPRSPQTNTCRWVTAHRSVAEGHHSPLKNKQMGVDSLEPKRDKHQRLKTLSQMREKL